MISARIDSRAIWALAIPAMLTNVATALIGIGDMWIVGRLGDAATQGAVDVGARLFALVFTVMNFLKTGTTGMVAQAGTREGERAQAELLARGLLVGVTIAALLLLAKPILLPLLLSALGAEGEVLRAARIYADIRYWSAPGVMANLALIGFLVGRRQVRTAMAIEIAYNLLNVGLGLWFVLGLGMGISGVAWSSFIAEYAKLALVGTLILASPAGRHLLGAARERAQFGLAALRPFLIVNRDLFLRTVVLMVSLAALTRLSAERGAVTLAANGIIYQLFVFSALLLDGFENAAQVLNGERKGAGDRAGFVAYVKAITQRGFVAALLLAGAFALFADPILASFAATPAVRDAAQEMAPWLVLIPFAGVAGFVFDGVYVGASWTRHLLFTMLGGAAAYALALWLTWPLGNHGLWASFTLFLVARAVWQAALMGRLTRAEFDRP
ncbi:MATE family efflux transporter [Sphingomicrobium lutaoense]|uniref:MATE family multidrug resistance protein n=1 Tax=Sphingomicrobium lutaoense TaxID=515949 RepID=A0A839Z7Y3_9SPHN|nr:MATE family efflux transporter [Sphingomicrobium lutaoense]MBB3765024.1 MATE family multidrug resistance protein [Sphingomicrobium lutaoense]